MEIPYFQSSDLINAKHAFLGNANTVSKTRDLCMDYSRADFKLMDILDKDGNINEILTDDM